MIGFVANIRVLHGLKMFKRTAEEFVRLSKAKFGSKFNYDKTIYTHVHTKLIVTCDVHGDQVMYSHQHYRLVSGCLECDRLNRVKQKYIDYINQAKCAHGDEYDYSKIVFSEEFDKVKKVEIICPQHGSFFQSLVHHIDMGQRCPKCALEKRRISLDEFILKAREKHGNYYIYNKVELTKVSDDVEIICPQHGSFFQRAASHLYGNGCLKCFKESQLSTKDEFIRKAIIIHGDVYDYRKVVYKGNKRKVEIICSRHGSFWVKPNGHLSCKNGCPKCKESYGEKLVAKFLLKNSLLHLREYRIKDSLFRYDFYLPEQDIYIEYNGVQHYRPVDRFGGLENHLKTKENDEKKKVLVKATGGFLITIDYTKYSYRSVSAHLRFALKRIYPYWFVVDGKVIVFKNVLDVYRYFNVNKNTLVRNLTKSVLKNNSNVRLLF